MKKPVGALRVVVDTNILVSALLVRRSIPGRIISLAGDKMLQTYYSDSILMEYTEILSRKKFNFQTEDIAAVVEGIKNAGISINPVPSIIPMPDESDRKFYDVAKSSGAVLITGNLRHYPDEPFIVTPAVFVQKYYSENTGQN